jgi:drug/metabolite transporter (DMT)-like permease
VSIALALAAAYLWGTADFLARFSSRRIGAYRTSFLVQCVGVTVVAVYFAGKGFSNFTAATEAGWEPWAWAALGGLINALGSVAFYRALEKGAVSVVAPISSSYPVLTLVLSLLSGERLRWLSGLGMAVVLIGVILASTSFRESPEQSPQPVQSENRGSDLPKGHFVKGVAWAVVAMIAFGAMFWILGFHVTPFFGAFSSVWIIRLTSLLALLIISLPARESLALPRGSVWWLVLGTGLFDTAAFLCNNIAFSLGRVSVTTVLVSLYSAVTVLYAWIFLRERLERSQWCGIALIFAGIFLVNM